MDLVLVSEIVCADQICPGHIIATLRFTSSTLSGVDGQLSLILFQSGAPVPPSTLFTSSSLPRVSDSGSALKSPETPDTETNSNSEVRRKARIQDLS